MTEDTMSETTIATAIITGGTSGIGLATAEAIVSRGGRVLVTGRDERKLARTLCDLGPAAAGVVADVCVADDLDRVVEAARRRLGDRVELVFANAGGAEFRSLVDSDEAHFDRIMDVNAKGAFFTVQRCLPLLGRGSSVVLNGSSFATRGTPHTAAVAASKAAVRAMGRVFAAELAERGIRVNVVSPGPIATPLHGRLGLDPQTLEMMAADVRARTALGCFGAPEDVAAAVLFLANNPHITGTELAIDGGLSQI
jgi:NAD(P)-dependent dehydrogenase (short-subunit alcohol dehydrogenase family)